MDAIKSLSGTVAVDLQYEMPDKQPWIRTVPALRGDSATITGYQGRANRWRFRPYILGEACWDNVYAALLMCHGNGRLVNRDAVIRHEKHGTIWGDGAFAEYNSLLASFDARYFTLWATYHARLVEAARRARAQPTSSPSPPTSSSGGRQRGGRCGRRAEVSKRASGTGGSGRAGERDDVWRFNPAWRMSGPSVMRSAGL
jgi:hypothetical protein